MNACLKIIGITVVLMTSFASLTSIGAEKYYTWVDEQGRIQHTIIPEEKNPLIADEKVLPTIEEKVVKQATPPSEDLITETKSESSSKEKKSLVTDDSKKTSSTLPDPEQVPITRSVEINEEDYIDGDVLEQQGNIRNEGDLPYYTWTDEQGVLRTSPYRPVSKIPQKSGTKKEETKKVEAIIYTVTDEYFRVKEPRNTSADNKVDDFAQNLFFKQSDFITSFSNKCCDDLPKLNPYELDFTNSTYIEITNKTDKYLFSEGKSPFLLIRLPHHRSNYSIELKSFIKNNSRSGVNNAVFYPQLVFLDDKFEVVRILRNPVLEYTPENWYKHGYLKGLFELDVSRGERYLLLNTTRDDLRSKNRIDHDKPLVINHQNTGSFELKAIYID